MFQNEGCLEDTTNRILLNLQEPNDAFACSFKTKTTFEKGAGLEADPTNKRGKDTNATIFLSECGLEALKKFNYQIAPKTSENVLDDIGKVGTHLKSREYSMPIELCARLCTTQGSDETGTVNLSGLRQPARNCKTFTLKLSADPEVELIRL